MTYWIVNRRHEGRLETHRKLAFIVSCSERGRWASDSCFPEKKSFRKYVEKKWIDKKRNTNENQQSKWRMKDSKQINSRLLSLSIMR